MWKNLLSLLISLACVEQSFSQCIGGNLIWTGQLNRSEVQEIVQMHNDIRHLIAIGGINQPSAMNMLEMEWDHELARKAQLHANKCLFDYDEPEERKVFGQNIGLTANLLTPDPLENKSDFFRVIQYWFKEVLDFDYDANSGHGKAVGHYTQMVWDKTYTVGCGYAYYLDGSKYTKLYVCYYGPAGNIIGQRPYQVGSGCSQGNSISPKYKALCRRPTKI